MEILDEKDGVDTELLVYAMTLINKVCVSAGSTCVGVFVYFLLSYLCKVFESERDIRRRGKISHPFDA